MGSGVIWILFAVFIVFISTPWLVSYFIFTTRNPDPDFCYVYEDSLEAFGTPNLELKGERNIAIEWRLWFLIMGITYFVTTMIPVFAGVFACCGEYTVRLVTCLNICFLFGLLVKGVLFWWGLFLRLSTAGRVAAGRMVKECLEMTDNVG